MRVLVQETGVLLGRSSCSSKESDSTERVDAIWPSAFVIRPRGYSVCGYSVGAAPPVPSPARAAVGGALALQACPVPEPGPTAGFARRTTDAGQNEAVQL